MAQDQKSGTSEALSFASSAAHTAQNAVKAGKIIAGTANGAAAGGPYGAIAAFLWENRRTVAKTMAAIGVIILIPILYISMLPGAIFGGYGSATSEADPNNPILNSEVAITDNAARISESIREVLRGSIDDQMQHIEADFRRSGADRYEVKNPYEADLSFSANQIISMYCASKQEDLSSISIEDLTTIMHANRKDLYSYTVDSEIRIKMEVDPATGKTVPVTVTDPETGAVTEVTESWRIYSLRYSGEQHFADHIFHLTEEQNDLAYDYAYNLSLFINDGMLQGLQGWDGQGIPSIGNVRFTDGVVDVIYYNQKDERYANMPFGKDHIGGYGCGPTAMAMVVSSLTDEIVDPIQMARWAYNNGYWASKKGSYHSLIPGAAKHWGLTVSGCKASDPQRIVDALADGGLVVALMYEGHFTSSGHFIVLRGVKDGKIMVADPASYQRSEQLWDLEIILDEAGHTAGAGGPFWIIHKP